MVELTDKQKEFLADIDAGDRRAFLGGVERDTGRWVIKDGRQMTFKGEEKLAAIAYLEELEAKRAAGLNDRQRVFLDSVEPQARRELLAKRNDHLHELLVHNGERQMTFAGMYEVLAALDYLNQLEHPRLPWVVEQAVWDVVSAWTEEGPQPHYHREMQRNLKTHWPKLGWAIQNLAGAVNANGGIPGPEDDCGHPKQAYFSGDFQGAGSSGFHFFVNWFCPECGGEKA